MGALLGDRSRSYTILALFTSLTSLDRVFLPVEIFLVVDEDLAGLFDDPHLSNVLS